MQEIIDETQPIKVVFSLTSPCSKNIYVSEKSKEGFVLKTVEGNESGVTFDWMVVVKRKFVDPFVEEIVSEETSFEPSSSEVEGGETESGVEISDGGEELTPPLQDGEVETPPSSEEDTTSIPSAEDVIVEEDNSSDPVEEPVVEPVVENSEETTTESSSAPEEVGVTAEEIPVVVE